MLDPHTLHHMYLLIVLIWYHALFCVGWGYPTDSLCVCRPQHLNTSNIFQVQHLSGGELQRVALTIALGKPADIYLIDEPSAYLDSEQRIAAAKVIKRCVPVFSYYMSPNDNSECMYPPGTVQYTSSSG